MHMHIDKVDVKITESPKNQRKCMRSTHCRNQRWKPREKNEMEKIEAKALTSSSAAAGVLKEIELLHREVRHVRLDEIPSMV
jgi:hypothetical protein